MNRFFHILLFLCFGTLATAQTDTIPPIITCPPNDTVTLGPGVCVFQYFYAITTGNEPGETLEQLSGLASGSDFPIGNTVNAFSVTDTAGNTASCSFQLTVQQYFGALSCQSFVSASIGPDCMWQPDASLLLDGKFGCPAAYLVELDKTAPYGNGPWEPASFGPDDVGKTYIFRVTDTISGNNCIGNIKANDMLPPVLTCQDFTISCAVDNVSPYFLKDSLGIAAAVPLAEDACGAVMLTQIESTVDSGCTSGFVGVISRKWTAQDAFGNTSSCVQQIHLTRPQLSDLRFPPNVTVNCANADISTAKTGQPHLEFAGRKFTALCSLGAAFGDSVTQQICPGSRQVSRTWYAIDWCTGDDSTFVQIIDIQDNTGPAFLNCPTDVTVTAAADSCLADVDLPDFIITDACSYVASVIAIWSVNGVADTLAGTLSDFPGNDTTHLDTLAVLDTVPDLPVGITSIEYVMTDGCGKTGSCVFALHVWDGVPPTPVCETFVMAAMTSTDSTSVSAKLFNDGSTDDCGALKYKGRRMDASTCQSSNQFHDALLFCCGDIGDTVVVIMRVYDVFVPAGPIPLDFAVSQSSDCLIKVLVVDPDSLCPNSAGLLDVAGSIKTETDADVVNVNIALDATHLSLPPVSLDTLSDSQGAFAFENAVPPSSDYTLTPLKDTNPLNGVSTFDLVLITKHILGLEYLNSPYKIIAADASHNDIVTTFDIVEIRKIILGIYSDFPGNTSWRFVDKDFVFPNPANPFQTKFPESIIRTGVASDQIEDDFVGIKIGDVNNNTNGDSLLAADDRARGVLFFNVAHSSDDFNSSDELIATGQAFTVHFKAAEKVSGYQFTLNLEGLEVVEVLPGKGMGQGNFGVFQAAVTVSVENGAGEFSIQLRANKPGQLSDMLRVSSSITRAEAYRVIDGHYGHYNNDLNDFNDPNDLLDIALRFDNGFVSKTGFELYQNQPNPFRDKTLIGFHLPENADATLTVFDETGRVLHAQSGYYPRGYSAVSMEQHLLGDAGVLYYKLATATDSGVRKMVRLRRD